MRLSVYSKSISVVLLLAFLSGCSLNPIWLIDHGYDWDPQRKKFPDTERNRRDTLASYKSFITREASGEKGDWIVTWKGIFEALSRSQDNAELYKRFIVEERRKHGLRELPFAQ